MAGAPAASPSFSFSRYSGSLSFARNAVWHPASLTPLWVKPSFLPSLSFNSLLPFTPRLRYALDAAHATAPNLTPSSSAIRPSVHSVSTSSFSTCSLLGARLGLRQYSRFRPLSSHAGISTSCPYSSPPVYRPISRFQSVTSCARLNPITP